MSSLLVIVKVAERCNLDCSYCFMYYGADQSWRERPKFLSAPDRALLIDRCVEHLDTYPKAGVSIELHGGEPLLLGKERMRELLDAIRLRLPAGRTSVCMQTNGTLIDEEWIDLFEQYHVRWGVSSDGPPAAHDVYRRTHDGRTTSAQVERAIRLGVARRRAGGEGLSGVLAVANPAMSGAELIRYFHDLGVPFLDLLLPDANTMHPPFYAPKYTNEDLLRYYIAAFEAWAAIDDPDFEVRIFTEIMQGLFGERSELDFFGAELSSIVVVETDGSYELVDVMHICGAEYIQTPFSLRKAPFSAYMAYAREKLPRACETCRTCPVFHACGGGYLPHRFDGKGFDNPSYYCDVLMPLIEHVYGYLRRVTPDSMWRTRTPSEMVEPQYQ